MAADKQFERTRMAHNTLLLYVRMLLVTLVSLYTSRIVLRELGVDNYGIYSAVGGFVTSFTLLSGSLSTAISRFLTYALGQRVSMQRLSQIFSTALFVQLLLGGVILLVGESFGVWFVGHKLVIPPERLTAAYWVLHCSLAAFVVGLIGIPYQALIIAHEKMSAFAYISVLEVVLKLVIAYALVVGHADRLKLYATLMLLVSVGVRLLYVIYCRRRWPDCRVRWTWDASLMKQIGAFAGWNSFENGSYILSTSGMNVMINTFFGVVVGAARGIALQVEYAVLGFVQNFMTALNPQITKSHAGEEHTYTQQLVFSGAKYAYFLMLLVALPLILECRYVLQLWLGEFPAEAVLFVQCTLGVALLTVLSQTLVTLIFATGKIRNSQLIIGSLGLVAFAFTGWLFAHGAPTAVCYAVYGGVALLQLIIRLSILHRLVQLPVGGFVREVLCRVVVVTLLALLLPLGLQHLLPTTTAASWLVMVGALFSTSVVALYVGMNGRERQTLVQLFGKIFRRQEVARQPKG